MKDTEEEKAGRERREGRQEERMGGKEVKKEENEQLTTQQKPKNDLKCSLNLRRLSLGLYSKLESKDVMLV